MPATIYDKIWNSHVVKKKNDGTYLLYVDRQLLHEVTSSQAFEGIRSNNRNVYRPEANLAVADHNVPTVSDRLNGIKDEESRIQVETLRQNCLQTGIKYYDIADKRQGIVHVVGPEQGFTHPGMVIVCGDSHTSTHGAFGTLAFGIGTSEVEHVLTTQTLIQRKSKNMLVRVKGKLDKYMSSKDVALAIIGKIGTAGGTGYVIEYAGDTIEDMSIEARMTLCNMSIEAGARAGLINPDQKTFDYLEGRPFSPKGQHWDRAVQYWQSLVSDSNAVYDKVVELNASELKPLVTWGTSPENVVFVDGVVPDPDNETDLAKRDTMRRAIDYMGLSAGERMEDITIDKVFIGSCTNGRIEDLRIAADVLREQVIAPNIKLAMVVPGSGLVKQQAEEEGLDLIFKQAGFEWREAGCSMCLAMNDDTLLEKERCASTSNRNFEGRQGRGGRTHLMSPAMAAVAAVKGRISDVTNFLG